MNILWLSVLSYASVNDVYNCVYELFVVLIGLV